MSEERRTCPHCRRPRVRSDEEWRNGNDNRLLCGRVDGDEDEGMRGDEAFPDCDHHAIDYYQRKSSWQELVLSQCRDVMRKAQKRIRGGALYDELGATMSRIDGGFPNLAGIASEDLED